MLKMLIMLLTMLTFSWLLTWELIVLSLFLTLNMVLYAPVLNNSEFISVSFIQMNNASFLMSILCTMSIFWAFHCMPNFLQDKTNKNLALLMLILLVLLQLFFYSSKTLILYTMFELSILPIFSIIMGWGYQSERLNASLSLMFYTLSASMPFLGILLWMNTMYFYNNLNCILSLSYVNSSSLSFLSIFCFMMAFAVKLPMFGVHIWLPKAHVEAPVFGSMVLASILLKLGSYGLWVFIPIIFSFNAINIWISNSLIGAVIISITCLRLSDMKMIIAYSSVSHMGLVLISLMMIQAMGSYGGLVLMLAHGVTSSAMFLMSYYIYQTNHSRSMILSKGMLMWSSLLPLLWFLILMTNMAAPPTFNLIAEILIISTIVNLSNFNILPLILMILLSTAYSLVIYSSIMQGTTILVNNYYQMTSSEVLNIMNHLVWSFTMFLAMGMINF